jgi:hypothetical protein
MTNKWTPLSPVPINQLIGPKKKQKKRPNNNCQSAELVSQFIDTNQFKRAKFSNVNPSDIFCLLFQDDDD